ncbi:PucR family transcriptional regulator [Virgibacillus kimchii]
MAISVKNALQLPIMKNTKLRAGHAGIDNHIKWVTVIEVLEDIKRLQKGEFLLTTGFKLLEDQERLEIFHDLLKSNFLSGVAIYTSFYMERIPDSFIELAEENDLPLIEIPTDINFSQITKAILEQIINSQLHLLEQSDKIHSELTDLILNDQSLKEVTERLSELTASTIFIYNELYDIIHSHYDQNKNSYIEISHTSIKVNQHVSNLAPHLKSSLEKETKVVLNLDHYVLTIYPILARRTCFGWIVMVKPVEDWRKLNDMAIERASTIYAMEFLKKAAIEETQIRIHSSILDDIFNKNYANEQIITDRALKLNYDLSLNQAVFHITLNEAKDTDTKLIDRLYYITEQLLIQKDKQHLIQIKYNAITFLTSVVGSTSKQKYHHCISLAKELMKEWDFHFPDNGIMIGIGQYYDQIDKLGQSESEAQYAIQLCDLIAPRENIIHYEDLGMYDLLLEMKQNGINLKDFYEKNISGLLKKSDKEIDLIDTIQIYFKNNQSIQQTAEELFIHRHTLRYRLNQIEERTGLNIKSADDRLKLELGVMAYRLVGVLE